MKDNNHAWAERPWVLSAFLAMTGLALYFIVDDAASLFESDEIRNVVATFIVVFSIIFSFSIERIRWPWVAAFSLFWAAVLALISHTTLDGSGAVNNGFRFGSGLLAVAIAVPLFQTIHKHGQLKLPYGDLHALAWSNVVSWCASWIFVGLSFALAYLLAALFDLIGLDFLRLLLKENLFVFCFVGGTFGAALGVLKENNNIVENLQKLVMTILSILAPIMSLSLVVFLIALPFTGLQAFWDATDATTPILLSCVIGAVVLVNAIIRNEDKEISSSRILRISAIGLSACVLPLAIIALFSMRARLAQYGLTPDRIWGMLAVVVGCVYGIAYLASLVIERISLAKTKQSWSSLVRANNARLALALCLLSLLLALPVVDFGRVSVNNQLERLEDGRTKEAQFDFAAFAFDFGPAGKEALGKLQNTGSEALSNGASTALSANNRWSLREDLKNLVSEELMATTLQVFPEMVEVPESLKHAINSMSACFGPYCALIWDAGSETALLFFAQCHGDQYRGRNRYVEAQQELSETKNEYCYPRVVHFEENDENWVEAIRNDEGAFNYPISNEDNQSFLDALDKGELEIRTVERKQVFIGGRPIGEIFK